MKRNTLPLILAFPLGGFLLPHVRVSWDLPSGRAQTNGLGLVPGPPQRELGPEEVFARAARVASPSVVNIDTTQRVRVRSFFDDFFDVEPRFRERSNSGSGVIIDRSGHILTNEHVVGGVNEVGKRIVVTTIDGRKLDGTVTGADRTTDVALVQVDGAGLQPAQLGTVRGLVQGQSCVAIGNPFGLRFTVTQGVISALGRPISGPDGRIYPDLIQHDALINPGNSGGALVNLRGQVIGINTLVDGRGPGIGFAIPIDTALRTADELKRYGRIKRPWLGLQADTNDAYYVRRYGVADVEGVVVTALYSGGPAVESGLQPGDVITRIDGRRVRNAEELRQVERSLKVGQRIEIEVQRGDVRATASLRVGEMP